MHGARRAPEATALAICGFLGSGVLVFAMRCYAAYPEPAAYVCIQVGSGLHVDRRPARAGTRAACNCVAAFET